MRNLIAHLQGKARKACAGLRLDEPYEDVKAAILRCFNMTEESKRRKLKELQWIDDMAPEEFEIMCEKLAERWLQPKEGV